MSTAPDKTLFVTSALIDDETAGWLAHLRVHLTYAWRHRRLLHLDRPTRFTELVQRRKLTDRDPRLPVLADKVLAKNWVARTLGAEWIIPTLWHGDELPHQPRWRLPFVVKSRHGCNQRAFVRAETDDWPTIRRAANAWTKHAYGGWLDEWIYRHIPRGILVEPFVGSQGRLPIDYKLYTFHGHVAFVQVHLDRETRHRWIIMDRRWRRVSALTAEPDPAPPRSLTAMIEAAEALARGIDFVRSDFYEIGGKPVFGEMTFYPGSGLDPFDQPGLDEAMGAFWLGKC